MLGNELNKVCEVETPSVLNNLQRRKRSLEEELSRVNEALKALEENPEVAKVLELVGRASDRY